ncbi:MAG: 4-(cytidine 5'-diphospho)-2-C-methyl-D-erythritol kinase [Dehalococcoidia bacterium]|nr:4-(cytidine 5'-diphospho)-2-C-methyl-D-erythritol kinase [Dehalococcoidia bacterium]
MIKLAAYGKINLTLEALGKREDGYYEIRSIMQTIGWHDMLMFEESSKLSIQCSQPGWDERQSLVSKAVRLLASHTGVQAGAKIRIEKRLPLSAGLGGDSSDATAVLQGLVQLWGLNIPNDELIKLALALGSDTPFFLSGGTMLVKGRGEVLEVLPEIKPLNLVLLFPPVPSLPAKTATMYSLLESAHLSHGEHTDVVKQRLVNEAEISSKEMFNVFEKVAFSSFLSLEWYRSQFQRLAGSPVHLAGAGPTLFALMEDAEQANKTQRELQANGLGISWVGGTQPCS